ncbi:MAG TPA: hypothetical protein PLT47_04850 [Bacteroidales bacterium]|nr:hypothetical protein [Bacteroidales bacterium]HQI70056.1 hypothetical protein [Bacteroidales bacterium]
MRILFCGVLLVFYSIFFYTGVTAAGYFPNNKQQYISPQNDPVTVYYKISGMTKPEDALLIDQILMKTGLVLSSHTNFTDGICKVKLKDIKDMDKINEHIRTAWKQIGYELFVETIDLPENK